MSTPLHIVVLAAGKGTRMKSDLPKVLHPVGGEPMLQRILRTARRLHPASTTVVLGHMAEMVRAVVDEAGGAQIVVQEPQLGTGHALLQTAPLLETQTGTVVLLYGDVPMLSSQTIERLLTLHHEGGHAATVLTAVLDNPAGLGRILRKDGALHAIVEEKDATEAEKGIKEFNSGIYAFALDGLFAALRRLNTSNAQSEYYLPDLIRLFREDDRRVDALCLDDPAELRGVNSRAELADMNAQIRDARNADIMASGVTLIDPATTWVGPDVRIGQDTVIHPNVYLEGRTSIGTGCEIQAGSRIINSTIEDRTVVQNYCVIRDSTVGSGVVMGPFSHIRPDSRVEDGAHVGNFVELKKTVLGPGSKANHLAYLGDATIGAGVNIGAGVITCNYDGANKHPTVVGDGAFVGTDSQLVAPVRIGAGAYVAAGSSITQDVPDGALGIARSRQENKLGWAERRRPRKPAK